MFKSKTTYISLIVVLLLSSFGIVRAIDGPISATNVNHDLSTSLDINALADISTAICGGFNSNLLAQCAADLNVKVAAPVVISANNPAPVNDSNSIAAAVSSVQVTSPVTASSPTTVLNMPALPTANASNVQQSVSAASSEVSAPTSQPAQLSVPVVNAPIPSSPTVPNPPVTAPIKTPVNSKGNSISALPANTSETDTKITKPITQSFPKPQKSLIVRLNPAADFSTMFPVNSTESNQAEFSRIQDLLTQANHISQQINQFSQANTLNNAPTAPLKTNNLDTLVNIALCLFIAQSFIIGTFFLKEQLLPIKK